MQLSTPLKDHRRRGTRQTHRQAASLPVLTFPLPSASDAAEFKATSRPGFGLARQRQKTCKRPLSLPVLPGPTAIQDRHAAGPRKQPQAPIRIQSSHQVLSPYLLTVPSRSGGPLLWNELQPTAATQQQAARSPIRQQNRKEHRLPESPLREKTELLQPLPRPQRLQMSVEATGEQVAAGGDSGSGRYIAALAARGRPTCIVPLPQEAGIPLGVAQPSEVAVNLLRRSADITVSTQAPSALQGGSERRPSTCEEARAFFGLPAADAAQGGRAVQVHIRRPTTEPEVGGSADEAAWTYLTTVHEKYPDGQTAEGLGGLLQAAGASVLDSQPSDPFLTLAQQLLKGYGRSQLRQLLQRHCQEGQLGDADDATPAASTAEGSVGHEAEEAGLDARLAPDSAARQRTLEPVDTAQPAEEDAMCQDAQEGVDNASKASANGLCQEVRELHDNASRATETPSPSYSSQWSDSEDGQSPAPPTCQEDSHLPRAALLRDASRVDYMPCRMSDIRPATGELVADNHDDEAIAAENAKRSLLPLLDGAADDEKNAHDDKEEDNIDRNGCVRSFPRLPSVGAWLQARPPPRLLPQQQQSGEGPEHLQQQSSANWDEAVVRQPSSWKQSPSVASWLMSRRLPLDTHAASEHHDHEGVETCGKTGWTSATPPAGSWTHTPSVGTWLRQPAQRLRIVQPDVAGDTRSQLGQPHVSSRQSQTSFQWSHLPSVASWLRRQPPCQLLEKDTKVAAPPMEARRNWAHLPSVGSTWSSQRLSQQPGCRSMAAPKPGLLGKEAAVAPAGLQRRSVASRSAPQAALRAAAHKGDVRKLQRLLEKNIDLNDVAHGLPALHLAIEGGHAEVVAALLAARADPALSVLHKQQSMTPLHIAAYRGFSDIVTQLLAAKAAPTDNGPEGVTPLHLAAQEGRSTVLAALLQAAGGGAVHSQLSRDGFSPLHEAALNGHHDAARVLLEAKADVDLPAAGGATALHAAAQGGHMDVLRLLVQTGCQINVASEGDFTPLHDAAHSGRLAVVEELLAAKASPLVVSSDGATAIHLALQAGHHDVALRLLAATQDLPPAEAADVAEHDDIDAAMPASPLLRALKRRPAALLNRLAELTPERLRSILSEDGDAALAALDAGTEA
eukprot:TRINITY_DN17230_c0_g1_i3.p1 TRINITY_DN17230_c0_g1~~TRINITY_DN17230_c0_g1_i3.p1  ORF type:complete len:1154 (-),score=248.67 TRINITY_DN17230_c0_g1_i3:66-3455(-)